MKLRDFFVILLLLYCYVAQAKDNSAVELEPVTIKLQWQHQFQFAGIYAAKEKGFYRDAGLDVSILSGLTHPYDEVENGEVEFGIASTGIVLEYLNGRPFVALGATFQHSPYVWLVKADSEIYSASDLIGKTLTRQSDADDLTAIFLKQNIDLNTIHFVQPSRHDINDLIADKVDGLTAYISNEPFLLTLQQTAYRTIAPRDYGINFYGDILFTSQDYLKHNAATVRAFREATYKGWRYAIENRDEIIDLIMTDYNVQHKTRSLLKFEADQLIKLSLYPTIDIGHMSLERWKQIAETYQDLGLYNKPIQLDNFLYQDTAAASPFSWLPLLLACISFILLLSYMFEKQRSKALTKQLRRHAASMEEQLRQRDSLEATAKQESLRLQALLDNTIDSVIIINQSGNIETYNKASERLFGYQPEDVIGCNITMLMPAHYRDLHKLGLARFLSTEEHKILGQPVEVEALHKNGHALPIELTVSAFRWQNKYLFTGIARDISKQKSQHQALLAAKLDAERANNAKSEFLSAMSHELRTPLNGILGFSQLLLNDKEQTLSEPQSRHVKQIIHNGEQLLALINDVLELSRIETGQIKTSSDRVPITTVFDECLPMLEALAQKKHVHIDLLNTTDAAVVADFTKVKQVFINLVSNAIKYNKRAGKVLISTSIQTHNATLKLTITDTGSGIPKHRQPLIFTAFERLGQEHTSVEGSGVSLSVSKRLIEAMGGKIDFTSTEGQGSSFWLELPLSPLPSNKLNQDSEADSTISSSLSSRRSDSQQPQQQKTVLYVEDNPANIRLMEVFFSRFEHISLATCETAEAALEWLEASRPDIILMDINLPGMSGIEATRLIHQTPAYASIPVIALTAAAMKENIEAADNLFQAYITKPVNFTLLTKTIQRYL